MKRFNIWNGQSPYQVLELWAIMMLKKVLECWTVMVYTSYPKWRRLFSYSMNNNTDGNNGTEILCVDVASLGKALSETTLMNIGRLYSLMHYLITYNVIPCSLVKLCPPCSYNYCSAYYNQLKCDWCTFAHGKHFLECSSATNSWVLHNDSDQQ